MDNDLFHKTNITRFGGFFYSNTERVSEWPETVTLKHRSTLTIARNGSGTYTAPSNSFNPAVDGTTIDQDDWNAFLADLETAVSASIASDGQTTTSAVVPFANGIQTDTVAEKTSNTGVTIDGVLVKDGRVDTAKGADIASGSSIDIGAASGNYVDITGTTAITAFGTITAGRMRVLQFKGAVELTHNATSLILPGGANITTAAGDIAGFVSEGSGNWRCLWYTAVAELPLYPAAIGVTVQGFDADTLKADVADTLGVGFSATGNDFGTKTTGTFTPDPDDGNFQYGVNGGAHTLAPPTNNCQICLQYTNNGSAGAITTSGFTKVTGNTITTTNGDDFFMFITKLNGFSHLHVQALQ